MNHVTEKKLNNKGFSLVELIIVIAIMAVLVGVLAPQYLRYVERSRVSSDRDNIEAIIGAIQVHGADVNATNALANGNSITITRTATAVPANTTAIGEALRNAGITNNLVLMNRQTFDQVVITVNIDGNGIITITPAYTNGGTAVTF